MGEQPGLNVASGDPTPRQPPPRRGPGAHIAALVGVAVAATAIVLVVLLLKGGGDSRADPPPPPPPSATTAAEPTLRIVFPEGFTRKEMAERIEAVNEIARTERQLDTSLVPDEYLLVTESAPAPAGFGRKKRPLEGFLFPATYDFTPSTTAEELVTKQLAAFADAWAQLDLTYAKRRNLTPYDVLTIASMIEGEVQVPRERALVAAVIYNRLRLGMELGIDATLRYGLDIPPNRAIRQSELENPTPYNTLIHKGLPPTPIGNPGLASLEAAARPADVDYLFFVRKADCKSHFFTASEAEFFEFLERDDRC
jgi:uncharacterized YceG family protein